MRRLPLLLVAIGTLLSSTGCSMFFVYDKPEYYEIGNSHTAYLVPMEGATDEQVAFDSEALYKERMIATKRVQIPHKWVSTGYWPTAGYWQDTVRLITTDRAPVTRVWAPEENIGTSNRDEGIWFESKDSVDASTGIECTARIPDDDASSKFLFNYPAATSTRSVQVYGEQTNQLVDDGTGLAGIMDTEIRSQIQSKVSEFAAFYNMDLLREKKVEMLEYVRHGTRTQEMIDAGMDEREGVIEFFAERGIEITTIGRRGGFTYGDPAIQTAITKVFQAQQDEEVAKAETTAQTERNKAVKLEADGLAEAARSRAAGEADAIQTVADAKAYEIEKALENQEMYLRLKQIELEEKRLERWDGEYPDNYVGIDLPGLSNELGELLDKGD